MGSYMSEYMVGEYHRGVEGDTRNLDFSLHHFRVHSLSPCLPVPCVCLSICCFYVTLISRFRVQGLGPKVLGIDGQVSNHPYPLMAEAVIPFIGTGIAGY